MTINDIYQYINLEIAITVTLTQLSHIMGCSKIGYRHPMKKIKTNSITMFNKLLFQKKKELFHL